MTESIQRIDPRSGKAFLLPNGAALTVVDPLGVQVTDLVAYNAEDIGEVISNGRTFDYEETISLSIGNRLWSNRSSVMLTIETDTVGRHDFLLTPCSEDNFKHFYPDKPVHRGCFGNLAEALSSYGIGADAIPTAFNIFMNVPVDDNGKISVLPPISKAGDYLTLRAHMNLIIGLTACSPYSSNGGAFKPIDYKITQ